MRYSPSIGRLGGRDVIASAGQDGTVRLRYPQRPGSDDVMQCLHEVAGLTLLGESTICAAVDSALCLWTTDHQPAQ